jgi:phosphate uptake regulator
MCRNSLRALEKHFNEKYGVKLNITTDRDYEYKVQSNDANDMHNKVEMMCTRIGTGKKFSSVDLRLIVTNLKMISEKKKEDLQISIIDKKGI